MKCGSLFLIFLLGRLFLWDLTTRLKSHLFQQLVSGPLGRGQFFLQDGEFASLESWTSWYNVIFIKRSDIHWVEEECCLKKP